MVAIVNSAGQQKRQRHKQLTFGNSGRREWDDLKERIETYTLPYVKQIANRSSLCDKGNPKLVLCDNLEGWGGKGGGRAVQEGGDTCMPKADSY